MTGGARSFPEGFRWGVGTSAYQIEGGATADGRGPSIWDTFSHTPGLVVDDETGDVACDHYHRWAEDLDLVAGLGLPSYRFSVSWPRVLPAGRGPVNAAGLDFYDRLVDGLLARGVEPFLTLYHWDLPQALEDEGGWLTRSTAEHFAAYAGVVASRLGDRVRHATTLNEPFCSALLGYGSGVHAPGLQGTETALRAAHHLNLAHGLAAREVRTSSALPQEVSVVLNVAQLTPDTDDAADVEATRHADDLANGIFLGPMLDGRYPAALQEDFGDAVSWAFVHDHDLATIQAPLDLLGVNYYTPSRICGPRAGLRGARSTAPAGRWTDDPARATAQDPVPWPGTDRAWSVPQPGPYTDMGWRIDPSSLTALLLRLHRDHPGVPLAVTENGCAYDDGPGTDGHVHDERRIDYLRSHLGAVLDAIDQGVDVRGYVLWTLLDNFEWSLGYAKRFGIVHVDHATQVRTPKDSAAWYARVVAENALVG